MTLFFLHFLLKQAYLSTFGDLTLKLNSNLAVFKLSVACCITLVVEVVKLLPAMCQKQHPEQLDHSLVWELLELCNGWWKQQCNQVRLTISGKNPTQSSHSVLTAIPSGRRLRTIKAKTTRLKSRFIPQAVRLLNNSIWQPSNGLSILNSSTNAT